MLFIFVSFRIYKLFTPTYLWRDRIFACITFACGTSACPFTLWPNACWTKACCDHCLRSHLLAVFFTCEQYACGCYLLVRHLLVATHTILKVLKNKSSILPVDVTQTSTLYLYRLLKWNLRELIHKRGMGEDGNFSRGRGWTSMFLYV